MGSDNNDDKSFTETLAENVGEEIIESAGYEVLKDVVKKLF